MSDPDSKVAALAFAAFAACAPTLNPAAVQEQQRAAFAQGMGYPTRKAPAELEATIQQQTKDFQRASQRFDGRLEAPAPITIEGVQGTCYTVVLRLADGATWGLGAEAGLRFDFQSPTNKGSGGPGLVGPGAVASVGCADATGTITMTMAPMIGEDPIGRGPYTAELWSHVLTPDEAARLEADKQRQLAESRAFQEREAARRRERHSSGCATCDARYQGCVGAGRSRGACDADYRSCAFREVGPDYPSACPNPRN